MTRRQDPRLLPLLPHRGTLLLLDELVTVNSTSATTLVRIDADSSFFSPEQGGVPSSIGLEYLGQTAALIGGYQQQRGDVEPHLGFLLGARSFVCRSAVFQQGSCLRVEVRQGTVVGSTLANFHGTISLLTSGDPTPSGGRYAEGTGGYSPAAEAAGQLLCEGTLSVMRRPLAAAAGQ